MQQYLGVSNPETVWDVAVGMVIAMSVAGLFSFVKDALKGVIKVLCVLSCISAAVLGVAYVVAQREPAVKVILDRVLSTLSSFKSGVV